jgi:hypothetical protein
VLSFGSCFNHCLQNEQLPIALQNFNFGREFNRLAEWAARHPGAG